jgi:hypothetical protein
MKTTRTATKSPAFHVRPMPCGKWELFASSRAVGQTVCLFDRAPTVAEVDAALVAYRAERAGAAARRAAMLAY